MNVSFPFVLDDSVLPNSQEDGAIAGTNSAPGPSCIKKWRSLSNVNYFGRLATTILAGR